MDPQMGSIIAQEVSDMKDLIRKQLAWNSEKHRLDYNFICNLLPTPITVEMVKMSQFCWSENFKLSILISTFNGG